MLNFQVGDQVRVYFKTAKAAKTKTQVFSGIIIGISSSSKNKTFRVVKDASSGVKVERTFPLFSPLLEKVEVIKKAKKVRRAKLYYLRDRVRATL